MKKAYYEAEVDIPEEDKHLYHKKNGRWELKVSEFEGIDDLVAPGLKTNNEALKAEKTEALREKDEALTAKKAAEEALAKVQRPGYQIVEKKDIDDLEKYRELGPIADIKKDLELKKEFEGKIQGIETEQEFIKTANSLGMNVDAVKDFFFKTDYGKGLKLGAKKSKDPNNKDQEILEATVSYDVVDGKSTKVETKSLSEYLEEKSVPTYLTQALFNSSDNKGEQKKKSVQQTSRVVLPGSSTTSASDKSKTEDTKVATTAAERFNNRRNERQLPWQRQDKS